MHNVAVIPRAMLKSPRNSMAIMGQRSLQCVEDGDFLGGGCQEIRHRQEAENPEGGNVGE